LFGDGESEPRPHALGIGGDRVLERLAESAPCLHGIERSPRFSSRESTENTEQHGILPSCKKSEQPSVDREQRRDPATYRDDSLVRNVDTGEYPEQCCLARAARSDERNPLAGGK